MYILPGIYIYIFSDAILCCKEPRRSETTSDRKVLPLSSWHVRAFHSPGLGSRAKIPQIHDLFLYAKLAWAFKFSSRCHNARHKETARSESSSKYSGHSCVRSARATHYCTSRVTHPPLRTNFNADSFSRQRSQCERRATRLWKPISTRPSQSRHYRCLCTPGQRLYNW